MKAKLIGATLAIVLSLGAAESAHAWHFDYRFVERVGTVDTPLVNGAVYPASGAPIRLRFQVGVFDDSSNPAPAGGFIGWSQGTITDSLDFHNTRTPGRLTPFNFAANGNGLPPMPGGEPFMQLTDIDASMGVQVPFWGLDSFGQALPMPTEQVRGVNTFVSVFEFTTTPGILSYTLTLGGSLTAASGWVGVPVPPDNNNTPLDPSDDIPGWVTYTPVTLPPQTFVLPPLSLTIQVPGPGSAVMLSAVTVLASRRRRS
jgi:hypothetical protein